MPESRVKLKKAIGEILDRELPGVGAAFTASGHDVGLFVPADRLREVGLLLRDDPQLGYTLLSCLTGLDRTPHDPRFEVIYHLRAPAFHQRIVLRVRAAGDPPTLPSVVKVWQAADWFEREAFDLLGIVFTGHPDLRRLLMPAEWSGFPLRKDYPLEGPGEEAAP